MERLTTRHCGVAVIKDKNRLKDAMEKLAQYEELEENQSLGDMAGVKISVFFEIREAEIYGGKGSVGYAECSIGGNAEMMKCKLKNFAHAYTKEFAKWLDVPESCIRIISETEYKANQECSNGDRIREMSDEELAIWIRHMTDFFGDDNEPMISIYDVDKKTTVQMYKGYEELLMWIKSGNAQSPED